MNGFRLHAVEDDTIQVEEKFFVTQEGLNIEALVLAGEQQVRNKKLDQDQPNPSNMTLTFGSA